MLPEKILKSDVLDILFENRNKNYGAYVLRKYYPQRLKIALAGVAGFSLLLFFLQQLKPKQEENFMNIFPDIDTVKLVEVVLTPDEPKPHPQPVQHVQQATANDNITVVVPDIKVKEILPTVEELDVSALGDKTQTGELTAPGENIAPASQGNIDAGVSKELPAEPNPNVPVETAQVMPQFPGGAEAFQKFMHRYLKEPEDLEEGEKIIVIVKFIVQADGSISGAEILKGGRTDLDKEVLRVINKMPKWLPGLQNGRNVAVYFKLPVTFITP